MSIQEKEKWLLYASVISSRKKSKILKVLNEKPLTPTQIKDKTQLSLSYTSKLLKELERTKIVICLNPNIRKGKLYMLTEIGKWVHNQLD